MLGNGLDLGSYRNGDTTDSIGMDRKEFWHCEGLALPRKFYMSSWADSEYDLGKLFVVLSLLLLLLCLPLVFPGVWPLSDVSSSWKPLLALARLHSLIESPACRVFTTNTYTPWQAESAAGVAGKDGGEETEKHEADGPHGAPNLMGSALDRCAKRASD